MAKRLLIIEGEKNIVTGLQRSLGPKGYGIYIAENVRHGLEVLESLHRDGVLLSLDLLEINDLRILNNLRSQYPRIPIVVMSSSLSRKLVLQSFAVGVKGHLAKPINHEQLQEALFIFEGHLN